MWALAGALSFLSSAPAFGAEHYAIVISGASGGEKYAVQQLKWRRELTVFLTTNFRMADANVVVLDEESGGSSNATAQNVRRLFSDLRRRVTRDDTLLIILLGHGTFDGADAKFNLVGPDLNASEWKALLDPIVGRVVVVNTTEASFPFVEALSQSGRIVITATDSAQQRFATVFPEYFIRSLADPSSDFDKNARISVWEAFASASAGVKRHYEQRGQLSTERPLLDDNGDRVGREADIPGDDGAVARVVYLDADPVVANTSASVAELERQRFTVEQQIEDLKARKSALSEEQYQAELERLLLELARLSREIRKSS